MNRVARCLLWTALACAALPMQPTAACSVTPCSTGLTLPIDGGSMPANALPLLWRKPGHRGENAPDFQLELLARTPDGVSTALELELVEREDVTYIQPRGALAAGTELSLSYTRPSCGREPEARVTANIEVGEPAPRPARLGKLSAHETQGVIRVGSIAGDCGRETWAGYADLTVELSDEARIYQDVLRYELRVDDDLPWIFYDAVYATQFEERLWASSLGPGRDRVFTACEPDVRLALALRGNRHAPALEPGKHLVRMVGILPDDSSFESDQLEVELRCDEQSRNTAGAGGPRPGSEEPPAADGGGGCSALRHGRSGSTGLSWLALTWFAVRARRWPRWRTKRSTP